MPTTRRDFLAATGAACAALATPRLSLAETSLGRMRIQTVSDGSLRLPAGFIFEPVPAEIAASVRSEFGLDGDTLSPPCNLTLVREDDRVILFDAGAGAGFQPSAGEILGSLDAAGVAPEDVTHVVFTHAHPDHIWGVLDDFDDPLFSEATHMIGRAEFDYWMDPATVDSIGAARQAFAIGAQRRLEVIADMLEFFEDGDEIAPGIAAVSSPGHTPGHMAFELRAGSEAMMIVGDAIGNHHIAFAHPSATVGADQDMDMAAATRTALLERLSGEGMRLVGFHLPEGGIGRADRSGEGFVFVPEAG